VSKPAHMSECTGFIYKESLSSGTEKDTITSVESTKLFTCYETPKVSFYMYVSPIEKTAWLLILIQVVIVWLLLNLFMISNDIKTAFSPLLFIVGTMIDEANPVPTFFKKSAVFKSLIISWILVAMLLSSCYQSTLVVELNSPLKGHTPSSLDETFCPIEEDLLDMKAKSGYSLNKFWHTLRHKERERILEQQHKYVKLSQAKNCFAILLFPTEKGNDMWSLGLNWEREPLFYHNLYDIYDETRYPDSSKAKIHRKQKLISGFLSPLSRHFYLLDDTHAEKMVSSRFRTYLSSSKNDTRLALTALEWEIARNEKVVIVGPDSSLANEISYLKSQYKFIKHCTIFSESLDVQNLGWVFWRPYEHKLDRYFRQLVESGIYSIAVKTRTTELL